MIIWGGAAPSGALQKGSIYNPSNDTWVQTSTSGAPEVRNEHTAVWTGTEMIIWGGAANSGASLDSGSRYDPVTDKWTSLTTTNAPSGRALHTALWTGSEMIIFGGGSGDGISTVEFNDGGRYCVSASSTPDYSLSCIPGSIATLPNTVANLTCAVDSLNAFSSAVNLDCTNLPAGIGCAFDATTITPAPNGSVDTGLAVDVGPGVAKGNYNFNVRGMSGGLNHTFNVPVNVVTAVFAENFSDGDANGWTFTNGFTPAVVGARSIRSGFALQGTVVKKGDALSPDFNLGNGTVEADVEILSPGAKVSLLLWFADKKNFVELQLLEAKDKMTLKQKGNGLSGKGPVKIAIDANVIYHLKVNYDGQNFHVSIDGNSVIDMPSVVPPGGQMGLRIKATDGPASATITNIIAY
jgi:hypothetical protein